MLKTGPEKEFKQQLRNVSEKFMELFGDTRNMHLIKAPGRVNLIGEHTDYNDGYVLPAAIDRQIVLAAQARSDRKVYIYSLDFASGVEFDLDNIEHDKINTWSNYPRGVAYVLQSEGFGLTGANIVMTGNVPLGAGLSSSAALEVATAYAFQVIGNLDIEPVTLIKMSQKAENTFVGVNCGIMDQFISRLGKRDHALFIDCRTHEYQHVPLPSEGVKILVSNTGVKRGLVDSEYNERRSQCEQGVEILKGFIPGIKALRDVSSEDFSKYGAHLPRFVRARCEHVITENERVLESIKVLENNDLETFGKLLVESHNSLRDKYEVSCRELDIMVDLANSIDGVIGSRMTGAGFGGCTVTLIQDDAVEEYISKVGSEYEKQTGIKPEFYVCRAVDGAEVMSI